MNQTLAGMKSAVRQNFFLVALVVTGSFARPLAPQAAAQEQGQGHAVVTATTKQAEGAVTIPRDSISIYENRKLKDLTGWTPLRGERAGLQLVILLDDSSRGSLGTQLNDLKSFVTNLPPTTQVAVGY